MLLVKRDKTVQTYDEQKLKGALSKVFKATNMDLTDEIFNEIKLRLTIKDGMTTGELQTSVENILMRLGYLEQARYFIIFRHINHHSKSMADKVRFMRDYLTASNAATGSKYDANANVTLKNVATLNNELFKLDIIKLNRYRLYHKIEDLYGKDLADEYIRQLESHLIYKHDESSILPYCVAVSLYPFLLDGLASLGGLSKPPKNLESFCGGFINLVFAISSQFAGACATPEFLMYFDYFARKNFGNDYRKYSDEFYEIGPELRKLIRKTDVPFKKFFTINDLKDTDFNDSELNEIRDRICKDATRELTQEELQEWYNTCIDAEGNFTWNTLKLGDGSRTIQGSIEQSFQQIVFSMNQPAAARGYQSVFWNISYFDKYYFEGIFSDFRFPDETEPSWESLEWIQKKFMLWFNQERTKSVITFPVESFSLLVDKDTLEYKDEKSVDTVAELYSRGHSFFTYVSDNPDALSSCCRLRNEVSENTFSYSLGAGGVATGSKSVMTLNINRFIQDCIKSGKNYIEELHEQIRKMHKFQSAFNELIKEYLEANALTVYNAGYISMNKQYLTLGINGGVEAAEFLGLTISPDCKEYLEFMNSILKVFNDENKLARTKELMFNTEFVPAENLGCKFYNWDKKDGYKVPDGRNCYNSYFYVVEDSNTTILDKFKLHGRNLVKYLDGGSALHCNLDAHLSKEQYLQLLKIAAAEGTNYFTFNIPNTICNECGHIDKRYLKECPHCHSKNIDYATRIIGYLKRISNFSETRQLEANRRYYASGNKDLDRP